MSVDQQTASQEMSERIAQTLFSTVAKDLGVLHEQVFSEYGPKLVLTPADATRTADGQLQVTSDRARQLFSKGTKSSYAFGMPVPEEFGPVLTQFAGKPKEALAELRKRKTGAATGVYTFQGKPVGICYGKVGDAKKGYQGGYGLAHMDAKHPGVADKLQEILDASVVDKEFPVNRLQLWDGKHSTAVSLSWAGTQNAGMWVITAFINSDRAAKEKALASGTTITTTREAMPASGELSPAQESMDTLADANESFQKDINSLSQGTIGEWFPDVRAIATWAGANRSTFLHETGHMFLDMRTKIAVKLKAKKTSGVELTKGEQHLLDSLEAIMKWLGTDLDSFSKMSVD